MYFQIHDTNVRIAGSMHRFPRGTPTVPDWAIRAYEWSECIVVEQEATGLQPFVGAGPGASLRNLLPRDMWKAFKAAAHQNENFDKLRAWAAMMIYGSRLSDSVEGMEPQLLARAAAEGKPVTYLEDPAKLAKALNEIPVRDIISATRRSVDDPSFPARSMRDMYDAWMSGDKAQFCAKAMETDVFRVPSLRQAFLEARNRAWAPGIEALLATQQRTLIVVGALHFCGPGNLEECIGLPLVPIPLTPSP